MIPLQSLWKFRIKSVVENRTITITHISDYKGWISTVPKTSVMKVPPYSRHWMSSRAGLDMMKTQITCFRQESSPGGPVCSQSFY
jgi:hypothetical protein